MNRMLAGLGFLAAALAAGKTKTLRVGGHAKLRFDVEDFPKGTRVVIDRIRDVYGPEGSRPHADDPPEWAPGDDDFTTVLVEVLDVPPTSWVTDDGLVHRRGKDEDLIGAETWFSAEDLIPE